MSHDIPQINEPDVVDVKALGELQGFEDLDRFDQLDLRLREWAGTVALAFATSFWLAALLSAIFIVFYKIPDPSIPSDGRWSALAALVVVLFSAPTVIILAVLNSTKRKKQETKDSESIPVVQVVDAAIKAAKS